MTWSLRLSEVLACPACGARLNGAACLVCRTDFPSLDGVPWLMPEPRAALIEWRGRLQHLLSHYATEAARQRAALDRAAAGSPTKRRLERMAAALDDQAVRIRALMQPLGADRRQEAHAVHVALGTELPLSQGLSSYYANLHRDWCWGDEENRAGLEAILASLPSSPKPECVLVLGAGAGRLAVDLHNALSPRLTVALDFNPLFVLAAKRILSGDALELYEFPIAPKSIDDHALLRRLSAPSLPTAGFELVLADASAPPFRNGVFNFVVTPWFTDVAGEPVARQMRRVNALLAPGGHWVNHGSLAFADAAPDDAWSLEELQARLPEAGFSTTAPSEAIVPYLASPASRHARRESVITFAARKEREVEIPDRGRAVPDWLKRSDLPVPMLPQFRAQSLSTRVYAFLLAMIDGERTVRDMARLMEQQKLMPVDDAEPAIKRFLLRALSDLDRPPAF